MKRIILSLALALPVTGCVHQTPSTPVVLAPGFSSQADQAMDQILVGAHIFYVDIQAKVNSGAYTPATTEKTALNSFGTALNAAQVVYVAYHNGEATQSQAQAAVNSVSAQQTALQNMIGAK